MKTRLKRAFVLAMAMLLSLGLVACQGVANGDSEKNTEKNNISTEKNSESQKEENDNSLSKDKLDWFETAFFNLEDNYITNMFLTSEYSSPADIDLGKLFYAGANGLGGRGEVPKEEATFVINKVGSDDLDVAKTTVAEMTTVLQKYVGLTLETSNKVGLDNLYYWEEKDAYYKVAGDTLYMKCDIVTGWTNEDGTITLQYKDALSSISNIYEVTLKVVGDSYQFVSNKGEIE